MATAVVGVIAEGVTDVEVLRVILGEHLHARGRLARTDELEVRELFPEPDGTTGGGWTVLAAWLEAHGPEARHDRFFHPLFADERPCDAVVVHLDADVAHLVAARMGWSIPDATPAARGDVIRRALEAWLFPGATPTPDHVLLPAVWCTETWLVVDLVPGHEDPEAVDPAPLLAAVSPGIADVGGRLKKSRERWRKLAKRRVVGRVDTVVARCAHLRTAMNELADVLGAP